jgi:hypothetical protein
VGSYDDQPHEDAGLPHEGGGPSFDAAPERDAGREVDDTSDTEAAVVDGARLDGSDGATADAIEEARTDAADEARTDAPDAAVDANTADGRSDAESDAPADGADAACTAMLPAPSLNYTFDDCDDQMPTLKDSAPGRLDALKKGDLHCGGGHSGIGVFFSGDDPSGLNGYLTVPGIDPARFTKALTLSAWVSVWKATYSNIIGRWYYDDAFLLLLDDTSFAFSIVHPSDGGTRTTTVHAPRVLYDWVHLVAVFDMSTVKLYEDGVLVDTATIDPPGSMVTTSRDLQMGGLDYTGTGVPGSFMKGMLDEVRLYDVALTAAQVRALDCP